MGEQEKVPPELPGEVWRGEAAGSMAAVCLVDGEPSPRAWWWGGGWIRASNSASWILRAWALAERARADKAKACFAAMLAHRDAIRILKTYDDTPSHMRGDGYQKAMAALHAAFDALRALGVEP